MRLRRRNAIRIDPNDKDAYSHLSWVLQWEGKHREAEIELRNAIELNPEDGDMYLELGRILNRLGRFNEAAECYEIWIKRNPGRQEHHLILAWLIFQLGEYEKASALLMEYIMQSPDQARALYDTGRFLSFINDYEDAVEYFRISAYMKRDNAKYAFYYLWTLSTLCPDEEIDKEYKSLGFPHKGNRYMNLIESRIHEKNGELAEAKRKRKESLELFRLIRDDSCFEYCAHASWRYGRLEESIEWHLMTIDCNPKHKTAYYNLGLAYRYTNRPYHSIRMYLLGFEKEDNMLKAFIPYSSNWFSGRKTKKRTNMLNALRNFKIESNQPWSR